MSAFSDEYDLSREDPRIIEDVQRAIRLKARREARLKASRMTSPQRESQGKADADPVSSQSSPVRGPIQIPPPISAQEMLNNDSEIDFSPSIGTMPLHPVPSSSNGGATLDWTGSASEDEKSEKRWTLHIRKHKDRSSIPSSRMIVEKQDSLYADKLARIKSKAKSHTLRKAEITSDQLQRRYNMLFPSQGSHQQPANLLKVARWYDKQDPVVKTSLDKAEPLTWLKHLWDKRRRGSSRPSWYLSALTMEEYAKTHTSHHTMSTIPEDDIPNSSPTANSFPGTISPSSASLSWNPSPQFLEPSLSRRRSSYDQQVSFEPHVESGRESYEGESRPSSEGYTRYWRNSLPVGTESAPSSIYSGKIIREGGSSAKNGHHLRNLAKRLRRRQYGSEEALSSNHNSMSEREHSVSEDGHAKMTDPDVRSRPTSLRIRSPDLSTTDEDSAIPQPHDKGKHSQENVRTATVEVFPQGNAGDGTPKPDSVTDRKEASPPLHPIPRRRIRVSLPSSDRISVQERDNHQHEIDEEKEREEYDRKAQTLDDIASQNYRSRHLLQRVGTSIREYDVVQSSLSVAFGVSNPKIPPDVLEAFSHDPSAVTSGTSYVGGWRAVEDIHDRIQRQRRILGSFTSGMTAEDGAANSPRNIFDDPITSLRNSLVALEEHRQRITSQAERVMETLVGVKEMHRTVKKDYNDTLAHTSLVYPELSQIVALEESYRNHYQQFWDIGLDALTFLLDTVTPFWRNYGKVIGQDVQDFLIIPWYRNEFTGQAKRYPITQFPRRSFRHWVGLMCLSFLSLAVTYLQGRAALELTLNWDLPWIAHTGLWWMVFPIYSIGLLIQWCAVLIESSIILAQSGVVVWWLGWAVNIFT